MHAFKSGFVVIFMANKNITREEIALKRDRVLRYDFNNWDPWGLRDHPRRPYEWDRMEEDYLLRKEAERIGNEFYKKSLFARFVDSMRSTEGLAYARKVLTEPPRIEMERLSKRAQDLLLP